jgi:signal transduction histidine kinase
VSVPAATIAGLELGPVLATPLLGAHGIRGVLTIARRAGQSAFGPEDLDMASGFANQASIALELAEARAEQQLAAMLVERDRIAADLHDHVIQQLFGTGLALQSLASKQPPGLERDRLLGAVDDLDQTITQIRTTIFQLQHLRDAPEVGVRQRFLDLVTETAAGLGFEPGVRFTGLLDTLPDALVGDLLAVLREALSNIARHAQASSANDRSQQQ